MADLGHDLRFGAFLPPDAARHEAVLDLSTRAEDVGLDVLAFQDHPYQPRLLDCWTLLSYVAARTHRVSLVPTVANVPLRPPAVLARAAASLDVLSGGRVELGVGAGYFVDAMASMGAPRRTVAENVAALDEAIGVIRALWQPGPRVTFEGTYYRLEGARPGPTPPHPIGVWVGSYKPRMLELTGRLADGWVPSSAYAAPHEIGAMTARLDAAAVAAGREPGQIRRVYNVSGSFGRGGGFLEGPPDEWAEQLAALVLEHGLSTFLLGPGEDAAGDLQRFALEVAPAVRELVERERSSAAGAGGPASDPVDVGGGSDPVARVAAQEAQRLVEEEEPVSAVGRAGQQTLLGVHAHLRQELARLREIVQAVAAGRTDAAAARSHLNELTMRQNYWTFGSFCAAYCRTVGVHHAIEDARMFPDLVGADPSLQPVIDKLSADHDVIARLLVEVDDALVAMLRDEGRLDAAGDAVDRLAGTLLAHLDYEEEQLLGPIGRLSIRV